MMSEEPIQYVVAGLGRAGWSIHVNELRQRADAAIIAVVDPVAERRREAEVELGCRSYSTLGRMLKREEPDVVVVASPSVRHGPDAKIVLRAGRHVVVEKPMALGVAEADSMIRCAQQAGRKLFVHQNYRFTRFFAHMEETVQSGVLGRLFHIRNYLVSFKRRNDWQTMSAYGGGVLNNTCPHNLDMILQLVGSRVSEVMGNLQQIASAGDVEDHVKALLKAENGCTVDMEVSLVERIDAAIPAWTICGSNGTLTSDGQQSTLWHFDPKQIASMTAVEGAVAGRRYGNDDELPWQCREMPALGPDRGTFYDNVTAVLRCGEPMRVTPESVREVIRVIAAIRKGSRFPGRPVRRGGRGAKEGGAENQ